MIFPELQDEQDILLPEILWWLLVALRPLPIVFKACVNLALLLPLPSPLTTSYLVLYAPASCYCAVTISIAP